MCKALILRQEQRLARKAESDCEEDNEDDLDEEDYEKEVLVSLAKVLETVIG